MWTAFNSVLTSIHSGKKSFRRRSVNLISIVNPSEPSKVEYPPPCQLQIISQMNKCFPVPVSGSGGEPGGSLSWLGVPGTAGAPRDPHSTPVLWPRFATWILDMASTTLLPFCDKSLISQKRTVSEFLTFKNYFPHPRLYQSAHQTFLFYAIMVHFSHLPPYRCWKIK